MPERSTEPNAEQRARIESAARWIREAAAAPLEKFRQRLQSREQALTEVMENLTAEQAEFSPAPEEWSTDQVGRHVARFLRECSQLSLRLAASEPPPTEKRKIGMMEEGLQSYEEVRHAVTRGFEDLKAAILNLRSPHDLAGTYAHPYFGDLNCRQWITFCFTHVDIHVRQIERIQSSPGYPAAGAPP